MKNGMSRRDFLKTGGAFGAVVGVSCAGAGILEAASIAGDASPATRLGWRLGCCAYSFHWLTFHETISKVASLGLKEIIGWDSQKLDPDKPEVIFGAKMSGAQRRETKERLGDADVKVPCFYSGDLSKEDVCRRSFEFAREMDVETIDGEPPINSFDMLEKLCDEYQINVAVHNHAKPSPYWDPETLLQLLKGRSKRLGACCDTGHWVRSGANAVENLKKLQGRILTFDLKDVDSNGRCTMFGEGTCDIRGMLTELHRQQFQGVFGIEYDYRDPDIENKISQCIEYFQNVAKELSATK
jgi:sugar phosphate isomerase/epimerase